MPAGRGGAEGEEEPGAPSAGINPAPHGIAQPGAASATKAALPLLWGRPYAGRRRWGGGRGEPGAPSAGVNPAPHGIAQPGAASATKAALPHIGASRNEARGLSPETAASVAPARRPFPATAA